jgi:carboxyvinyl-carboxyphosphonate phosphorylmutase
MNVTERRERLRGILAGDALVPAPTIWDPISARIAENLGFEVGILTGHTTNWVVLGESEWARLTLTELAEQARRICRASSISVFVTGPFGFGNALNVMRYVEELENAGVSGICLEDRALPLTFGCDTGSEAFEIQHETSRHAWPHGQPGNRGDRVPGGDLDHGPQVPLEEYVGRIKAARVARQDPNLVIAARTNVICHGTFSRLKAYETAGLEAIWATHAAQREQVEALHAATNLPFVHGGTTFNHPPEPNYEEFLVANGARLQSLGSIPFYAVVKTIYDTLKAQRDGKRSGEFLDAPPKELMAEATRQSQIEQWITDFLN